MNRLSELLPVGPPLSEAQQIGRTSTIESLEDRLRSGQIVKMLESRRVGKTSVARAALARIGQSGGTIAEVNLASGGSPENVARDLAGQLASGALRARERLGDFVSGLRQAESKEAIGEEGLLILRATEELLGTSANPATVLEAAAARIKDDVTAVLLDEAHVLAAWPEPVRTAMGAVLKDNQALGVVIASSERHALEQLTSPDGPLRFVGTRFELPAIAHEDWQAGLRKRFAALGAPITTTALEYLLEQSHGHPYCTMLLAHESVRLALDVGEVSDGVVQAALVIVRRDEAWQELL